MCLLPRCCGVVTFLFLVVNGLPCSPRQGSSTSLVCVCNSTYCDTLTVTLPDYGKIHVYTSSRSGQRFKFQSLKFLQHSNYIKKNFVKLLINSSLVHQTLKGFGGAVTDAAAINAWALSAKARTNLIKSYFSEEGIEYNLARVPIGSCDFSTRKYTYLDTQNDFNLSTFSLAMEDKKFKIPILKEIISLSSKAISLYASPWTAPAWMKSNGDLTGYGHLLGKAGDKYHKTWAEYFTRFFDEYKKHGIEFWGVTVQNEPSNGLLIPAKWQAMGWTPDHQRDFVKKDLGPMLKAKGYGHVALMVHDDQRLFMPSWPNHILSDTDANQYVSGIAVHWYWDWLIGPEVLEATHELFPDKFLLATEACNKSPPSEEFGSWESGEKYSDDIFDNLNNWAVGWVDWNICLDTSGGPNWANNFDDSPVIVNSTADEFYKQPMFYHLGHFSKFIQDGSVKVFSHTDSSYNLNHVSILRKDGVLVLIILNKENQEILLEIDTVQRKFHVVLPPQTIQTFLWRK